MQLKLIKIDNRRGYPNLHFEIDGKLYSYGILGIKADYTMILRCQKQFRNSRCNSVSFILPSDSLKRIIQDKPTESKYCGSCLSGHKSKRTRPAKPTHFFENPRKPKSKRTKPDFFETFKKISSFYFKKF